VWVLYGVVLFWGGCLGDFPLGYGFQGFWMPIVVVVHGFGLVLVVVLFVFGSLS